MRVLAKYKEIKRDEEICSQKKKKEKKDKLKRPVITGTDLGGKKYKKVRELNLNVRERKGLESLRKRVQEGELVIAQTDKSSRFSVLSREQYIKSGTKHTSKDTEIGWKHIKTLQRHTNDHVWWLSRALRYSTDTDQKRMTGNIMDHGAEVPEMVLLLKDHKKWSPESGAPVPSRPVVSGNKGLNTHLSELISEILEPVALNMQSVEVSST